MKLASPVVRAQLFKLLGASVAKGLPVEQALQAKVGAPVAEQLLRHTHQALLRGLSLARAGMTSGLCSPVEATLLDASVAAGQLPWLLPRLGLRLEGRLQHGRALRQVLLAPLAVLLASILLLPLPLVFRFGPPATRLYFLFVTLTLLLLAFTLLVLPRLLDSTRYEPSDGLASELPFLWPALAAIKRKRNAAAFLEALGLLLRAELPIAGAVQRATLAVSGDSARTDFKRLIADLDRGEPWEQALERVRGLDPVSRSVLLSGVATGRLAEFALQRGTRLLEEIRAAELQLARRVGRLVYAVALLWLAADVFG